MVTAVVVVAAGCTSPTGTGPPAMGAVQSTGPRASAVTVEVGWTTPTTSAVADRPRPPTPVVLTRPSASADSRGSPVPGAGTTGTQSTVTANTSAHSLIAHLPPPASLVTPAAVAAPDEGSWKPFGPAVGGFQGAYSTLIRPDAVNTSTFDAVVWFDPTVLRLRQYPGMKVPGTPWDRPPYVEPERQTELVAAFSGGFRMQDSHGGLILGTSVLRPMRSGAATFAIDQNGTPNIGAWGTDITDSPSLDSARQNLDLIVIDGAPVPGLATDPNKKWGATGPRNKPAVWRSGAGIRADGSIVWVGGDRLSVETLAETLVRAGAIRGMQLEINKPWVQLNAYAVDATGQVHGKQLLAGMEHTGDRWLTQDDRDFIAVFMRTVQTAASSNA